MINKDAFTVTWISDVAKISRATTNLSLNCLKDYYPFVAERAGSHCPIFITGGYTRKELNRWPLVTLRDGWLPLAIFFQTFHPDHFSCRFAIPADHWYVVPEKWQSRVELYKTFSDTVFDRERLPEKILICGSFSSDFATDVEIDQDIEQVAERLGGWNNLAKIPVAAFMTSMWSKLWWIRGEPNQLTSPASFLGKFKKSIELPLASDLLDQRSFGRCLYVEINRKRLFHDTSLSHLVLSRGGGLLASEADRDFETERTLRLSFNHSIAFGAWRPLTRSAFENFADFKGYYDEILLEGQARDEGIRELQANLENQYRA